MANNQDGGRENPIEIHKVQILGLKTAREGIVSKIMKPTLEADTITKLFFEAQHAAGLLKQLDLVKDVEVEIEKSKDSPFKDQKNTPINVTLRCTENKRTMVKTGAEVSGGEFSGNITGKIRNVFGGGEFFELNNTTYRTTGNAVQARLSTPIGVNPNLRFDILATQNLANQQLYSGHKEVLRDFSAKITKLGRITRHDFLYNLSWREINDLSASASPSVRAEAGHSLKSSLVYNYEIDTLDSSNPQMPSYKFKLHSEIAGLGGDVLFSKSQVDFKSELNVYKRWSILSVMRLGAIFPILNQTSTSITDRFFLGGPMSVRGVSYRGMGPFDKTNCLGGDVFGIASLSLLTPLPLIRSRRFNGQVWVNAGSLKAWEKGVPYSEQALSLFKQPTVVTGLGITYQLSNVRLELNYCLPISAFSTDKINKGFQFGLGILF